MRNWC